MQQPNEEIDSVIVQLQVPADVFPVLFLEECVRTFSSCMIDYAECKFNVRIDSSFDEHDIESLPKEWRAALKGTRSTRKALKGVAMGLAEELFD